MKKKKSKSKKSKKNAKGGGDGGYGGDSDEMNEDDNDYPVVDIVAEDMPEGALESDEDDRRLRDLNDPHRLLNFDDLEAAMLVLSMTHCKFRHYPDTTPFHVINQKSIYTRDMTGMWIYICFRAIAFELT